MNENGFFTIEAVSTRRADLRHAPENLVSSEVKRTSLHSRYTRKWYSVTCATVQAASAEDEAVREVAQRAQRRFPKCRIRIQAK